MKRSALLDALRPFIEGAELSKPELAVRLGISPVFAGRLIRRIKAHGLLYVSGYRTEGTVGRPPAVFALGPGEDAPVPKTTARPVAELTEEQRERKREINRRSYLKNKDRKLEQQKGRRAVKNAPKVAANNPFLYGTPQGERNEG